VSLGAFLFVSISSLSNAGDVTRIAAQVVSGIGFLGAGVIIRDGTNIRGLNTAATLWCSAAIGALTALGLLIEASIGVIYILLSNLFLRFISRKLLKKTIQTKISDYILTIIGSKENEKKIKETLFQKLKFHQIPIIAFSTEYVDNRVELSIQIEVESVFADEIDLIINKLCLEDGILSIKYDEVKNYIEDDDDDYEDK
jgi:putative Mg2+ transporter-C (MgtC) family protein